MLKSVSLNKEEKDVKIEVKEKNNDLRNGLIIWAILAVVFTLIFKG